MLATATLTIPVAHDPSHPSMVERETMRRVIMIRRGNVEPARI
jgi:hypothetical protein